jgi:hypothetical protein
MEKQDFQVNPKEWWHFDYKDWKQYPILNMKFEELGQRDVDTAQGRGTLINLGSIPRLISCS